MKKYWIGDLCYVIRDELWSEFCDKTSDMSSGTLTLSNGIKVSFSNTAYGDGGYQDQFGNNYSVDAGLIGIVKLSDIFESTGLFLSGGNIFEFDDMPEVSYTYGLISFGNVHIDTAFEEEEEEEEDYYE